MNLKTLLSKFSQGINWNGLFYAIYKLLVTALTFILFKYLTPKDFSTWANINSIIFLILLWIDFGFRKSIPRYCPEFAQDKASLKRFVTYIITFQAIVLLIATPVFMLILRNLTAFLHIKDSLIFLYLGAAIFFIEGIVSLLRLIYHAHFWNKQFNIVNTIGLLGEMIANMIIISNAQDSMAILKGVFATKLTSGLFINTIGILMLRSLYKDKNYPGNKTINFFQTLNDFIKHSSIMWVNNNLKSISERNFLVPFFTYSVGIHFANLFKVANDGALFFYRIVLKTIGTTDTALLAHIQTLPESKKLLPIAFKKLSTKIASLCIPLLGILGLIYVKGETLFHNPFVFQIFFIMTIGYLIEYIVSPYERVLEIKRQYITLMYAYMPYIFMIVILLSTSFITSIGLLGTILMIHVVRLVSSFIMVFFVRRKYALSYPLHFALILSSICVLIYIPLYILVSLLPLHLFLFHLSNLFSFIR
jgi:hypothetical protein